MSITVRLGRCVDRASSHAFLPPPAPSAMSDWHSVILTLEILNTQSELVSAGMGRLHVPVDVAMPPLKDGVVCVPGLELQCCKLSVVDGTLTNLC